MSFVISTKVKTVQQHYCLAEEKDDDCNSRFTEVSECVYPSSKLDKEENAFWNIMRWGFVKNLFMFGMIQMSCQFITITVAHLPSENRRGVSIHQYQQRKILAILSTRVMTKMKSYQKKRSQIMQKKFTLTLTWISTMWTEQLYPGKLMNCLLSTAAYII